MEVPPAEALVVETAPEAPPKRRGRPPKARPAEAPAAEAPAVGAPKRRGRPPKNAAPSPLPISVPEPEDAPKRRGRPPKARQDGIALVYRYEGAVYPSLAQVVRAITGAAGAWSAQRFFGVAPESLSAGESVTREWDGKTHRVTVELPNG